MNETRDEACGSDFSEYEPLIGMVLPREGANTGTTPVHIYGRNFTRAICEDLRCKFGEIESPRAMYISNNHIICEAPDISEYVRQLQNKALQDADPIEALMKIEMLSKELVNHTTVPIMVDFGDGNFTDIDRTFTYKYEPFVPTVSTTTHGAAVASNISVSFGLVILLLNVVFATSE